jgi:hypothetical protein
VGEAAHIYGANPGSARFDPNMTPAERSDISNGIWLCANCHKLIDDDPDRYPAGLLFEWQREHELRIAAQVGKAGAEIRRRYEARHLDEFGRLSYLAERILVEKNDCWEYRLTAEVLRFEMTPVLRRWTALKRKLYVKPSTQIARDDFARWMGGRMTEFISIIQALSNLLNDEFARAWGEVGVPGNDADIISTCRLFSEACQSALAWAESVWFIETDEVFDELRSLFVDVAGQMIDEAAKVPAFFAEKFSDDGTLAEGTHELQITFNVPESWADSVSEAFERATRALEQKMCED